MRGAFPVLDAAGKPAGAVFVIHDLTALADGIRSAQLRLAAVLAGVGVLLAGLMVVLLNTLVFKRLDAMREHMEDVSLRLAGGEFDVVAPEPAAHDEIGDFERFYADFVHLIGGTLKQLASMRKGA